tara:strand:- start:752 stop:1204 length:453 start_codon:yes stop_codon:yes gene_type:complete
MKITFDTNKHPFVVVTIDDGEDKDNILYESFMTFLEKQYKEKNFFYLLFDTENLTTPNILLLRNYIQRIQQLKTSPIRYLQFYIIVTSNPWIKKLLYMLWNLCKPMSVAYLVDNSTIAYNLLHILSNPNNNKEYIHAYVQINDIPKIEPE